jgi:hypothetical protein
MIPDEVLGVAVERRIISAERAAALGALARERDPNLVEPQDEEKLRFVSGFRRCFRHARPCLVPGVARAPVATPSQPGFLILT